MMCLHPQPCPAEARWLCGVCVLGRGVVPGEGSPWEVVCHHSGHCITLGSGTQTYSPLPGAPPPENALLSLVTDPQPSLACPLVKHVGRLGFYPTGSPS